MECRGCIIGILLVLAMAGCAVAHGPKEVSIEFDPDEQLLTVVVDHGVKDAAEHYIKGIDVELNGEKIIEQSFKSQVDMGAQQAVYRVIDAGYGDELTVTAHCNLWGKKSQKIKIEKKQKTVKEQESDE
jgi:desulfoferrodoxin (superoxide reductase-like protein)